jgi:hypothetical protein
MVLMSVLNNALVTITNAERRGKRQVCGNAYLFVSECVIMRACVLMRSRLCVENVCVRGRYLPGTLLPMFTNLVALQLLFLPT